MLPKSQQIQEEEYFLPYHWSFDRATYGGRIYFGYLDICLSFLDKSKVIKVLDAGCGDGRFLSLLKDRGIQEVYGVDYSERAVSFAQILVPTAKVSVENLMNLPYENFFDVIFLIEVLEHIDPKDTGKLLNSLKKSLKSSGELIISTPSVNIIPPEKHFQHFSEKSIRDIIEPYFEVIEIKGQGRLGPSFLGFLYKFLDNRYWLLRKIAKYYNLYIWPKYFNVCDVTKGQRIIARCGK